MGPFQADHERRVRFLATLPPPLRALNFAGWTFLDRQDMTTLAVAYRRVDPETLHFTTEWAGAFQRHAGYPYDVRPSFIPVRLSSDPEAGRRFVTERG